jgi:hypothetical protein
MYNAAFGVAVMRGTGWRCRSEEKMTKLSKHEIISIYKHFL